MLTDNFALAAALLPDKLRQGLSHIDCTNAEEIRLRAHYRPSVYVNGAEKYFSADNVEEKDILCVLERATGASLHSVSAQIAEGYICCGGVRVGLCGKAVIRDGALTGLKEYSSLAIRIPREIHGICDRVIEQICAFGYESTLILSPPGGGKTTALRELIRLLSENGTRVSVIDERSEISAAGVNGTGFLLGPRTDVLAGVGKERGAIMLLRGMNPQIIAMDEITSTEDAKAVSRILGCGVKLLATAHCKDQDELMSRALYRKLIALGAFKYLVLIGGTGTARTYNVKRLEQ